MENPEVRGRAVLGLELLGGGKAESLSEEVSLDEDVVT